MSSSEQNQADLDQSPAPPPSRFSLHSLSAAFARLTGTDKPSSQEVADALDGLDRTSDNPTAGNVLSPRMIVEGMLFVGNSDRRPLTNREIASHIRDVSPKEVDELIQELNLTYQQQKTSYHIVSEGAGYQMELRSEFDAVGQRFRGRIRQAKLTPPVIEVLAVVAYRQPVTADHVTRLRGSRSHAILSQLVRRGLLCIERPEPSPQKATYQTTDRFNRLFGVDSPKDLPSNQELDDN